MKICTMCKKEKELMDFSKDAKTKDGLYHRCRSCHKEYNRLWRLKNITKCKQVSNSWKRNNKEKNLAATRVWQKKQFESNSNYALAHSLRTRLNQAVRSNFKAGSAVRDLGCSIEEFRKYIESKFIPGMSWKNRGKWGNVWHIDHIRPLVKFDLADREQFMEACNYTNMQPMWCIENNMKAGK